MSAYPPPRMMNGELSVFFNDNDFVTISGEKGEQGEEGPQGPQGPAGADGADGVIGPQGIQGPAGFSTITNTTNNSNFYPIFSDSNDDVYKSTTNFQINPFTGNLNLGPNLKVSNVNGILNVAMGQYAGLTNQGQYATAIGLSAGQINQGQSSTAVGLDAGKTNQGDNCVAIGRGAQYNQTQTGVDYAIAIGYLAGYQDQHSNTIVLNAQGIQNGQIQPLNTTQSNSLYIAPIREATNNKMLVYDTTTKEITYTTNSVSGSLSANTLEFTYSTIPASLGSQNVGFQYRSGTKIPGSYIQPNTTFSFSGTLLPVGLYNMSFSLSLYGTNAASIINFTNGAVIYGFSAASQSLTNLDQQQGAIFKYDTLAANLNTQQINFQLTGTNPHTFLYSIVFRNDTLRIIHSTVHMKNADISAGYVFNSCITRIG